MRDLLIIDDEYEIRNGIARYFPWNNLAIEVAAVCEGGAEALALLARRNIDLILCDIRMPEMDGIRFAEIVREYNYPCQIVFLSAHKDFEYARKAIELGVKNYIIKPAGYDELYATFSKLVREEDEEEEVLRDRPDSFEGALSDQVSMLISADLRNASLSSVSDSVSLSPNYLSSLLYQECGKTFSALAMDVRMKEAASLLRDTRLKVYEICEMVGYANVKSFTRAFRHYYGIPPREFGLQFHEQ